MKQPRGFGVVAASRRAFVLVVVVALLAGAWLVGAAGAQDTQNTARTVDSCTTIDEPGRYTLTGNITGVASGEDESCIEITANNVTLDGAGHAVAGSGLGHGIETNGSRNVTVRRLQASNWSVGIFYLEADNGTIRDTITNDNTQGLALGVARGNRLANNTAYDNAIAIALGGESQNNTLRNNVAVENKWGIHFERESANNTVVNNVARNNTRWDYYSERNEHTNTVRNLELSSATVSLADRNVALRSVTSPPALPRGTGNLNTYVEVSRTRGGPSALSLTMQYPDRGGAVSLYRHDGQYWSKVRGAQVDASTVEVNLTEFGILGVLAEDGSGGPVTVTTNQPKSVAQTLTTAAGTAPTAPADSGSAATQPQTTATEAMETADADGRATTEVERGESDAIASTFGIGPLRLVFAVLGLVALATLGLAAVRQSR